MSIRLVFYTVFSPKPFHTAGSIDEFLLAGKKWMAVGAYLNMNILRRRVSFYNIATGACYGGHLVLWMDTLLHS